MRFKIDFNTVCRMFNFDRMEVRQSITTLSWDWLIIKGKKQVGFRLTEETLNKSGDPEKVVMKFLGDSNKRLNWNGDDDFFKKNN